MIGEVVCPACHGRFHDITALYDPNRWANGTMFRLKKKYRDYGWESFTESDSTMGEDVACPECHNSYTNSQGRVKVVYSFGVLQWISVIWGLLETTIDLAHPLIPEAVGAVHTKEYVTAEMVWPPATTARLVDVVEVDKPKPKSTLGAGDCPNCGRPFKNVGSHMKFCKGLDKKGVPIQPNDLIRHEGGK